MNNKYATAFTTVKNAVETLYAETQLAAPENQPTALTVLSNLAGLIRELDPTANGYITDVELLSHICERVLKSEHDNPIADAVVTYYDMAPTSLPIKNMRKILIEVDVDGKNRRRLKVSVLAEDNQCVKTEVVIGYIVPHDVDSEFNNGFAAHAIYQSVIKHGNEYIDELRTNFGEPSKPAKTVDVNELMEKALNTLRRKYHIAETIVKAVPAESRMIDIKELVHYSRLSMDVIGGNTTNCYLGKIIPPAVSVPIGSLCFSSATPGVTKIMVRDKFPECLKEVLDSYIEEA